MRWSAATRWSLSALPMAALAALLTVLAGPSAAATVPSGTTVVSPAVVEGLAPNGAEAALRSGQGARTPVAAPLPAPADLPDPAVLQRVHSADAPAESAPGDADDPAYCSRSERAPPALPVP